LFKTETGVLFFDFRRAMQRVAYENILAQLGHAQMQQLLIPIRIDLRRQSLNVTEEMIEELAQVGFSLVKKSSLFYEVTAIPSWITENSGEAFLYDWLVLKRAKASELQVKLLAQKAADYVALSKQLRGEDEMLQLAYQLMACSVITHSPDGAIIYFELSNGEIHRRWTQS
jgi:DNA mismatch repair ATPase MutL